MSKGTWLGGAAGVLVVLGLGLYFWLLAPDARQNGLLSAPATPDSAVRPGAGQSGGTAPGLTTAPMPPVLNPALTAPAVPGAAGAAAPWATPAVPGAVGAAGVPAKGIPIGKPGAPSLEDLHKRLQALVANGRQPTAREVEAVLADLQRNQGSNVVNGINLQALRDNLIRTDRIQQIAQEMQAIAANPRKEDLPRLQSLTAEMQRLNAAMVINVGQPASR